jgi:hypothetical protein
MPSKLLIGLAGVVVGCLLTGAYFLTGWERAVPSPLYQPSASELAMGRRLTDFRLDGVPFDEAVAFLGEVSGAKIRLDDAALRQAGLDPKTPITVDARDATGGDCLSRMCGELYLLAERRAEDAQAEAESGAAPAVAAPSEAVGYTMHEGTIWVTPISTADANEQIRAYDIRDLLMPDPLDPDQLDPSTTMPEGDPRLDEVNEGWSMREERVERVIDLVLETAQIERYVIGLSMTGEVRELDGRLIVTLPWQYQRRVESVLAALRRVKYAPLPAPGPAAQAPVLALELDPVTGAWVETGPRPGEADVLARRVPRLALDGVPFEQALERLGTQAKTNIQIDWGDLQKDGWQKAPVHVNLRDVTLGQAVRALLRAVGAADGVSVGVQDGIVTLGAVDEYASYTVVWRLYPVQDLLARSADWRARLKAAERARPPEEDQGKPYDYAGTLLDLVEMSVDPESWHTEDSGRGGGSAFDGTLLIRQTPANHARIDQLLGALRRQAGLPTTAAATRPATAPATTRTR